LTCSGLRNRAVRFMAIRYHIGIHMSIVVLGVTIRINIPQPSILG
jgi:hypothetical protein